MFVKLLKSVQDAAAEAAQQVQAKGGQLMNENKILRDTVNKVSEAASVVQDAASEAAKQAQAKGEQLMNENKILRDTVNKVSEAATTVSGSVSGIADNMKSYFDDFGNTVNDLVTMKICGALKDIDFKTAIAGIESIGERRNTNVQPLVDVLKKVQTWYEEGNK